MTAAIIFLIAQLGVPGSVEQTALMQQAYFGGGVSTVLAGGVPEMFFDASNGLSNLGSHGSGVASLQGGATDAGDFWDFNYHSEWLRLDHNMTVGGWEIKSGPQTYVFVMRNVVINGNNDMWWFMANWTYNGGAIWTRDPEDYFEWKGRGSTPVHVITTTAPADFSDWSVLSVVVASTSDLKIYIDTTKVLDTSSSDTWEWGGDANEFFRFGPGMANNAQRGFYCDLSAIAIYENNALAEDEVIHNVGVLLNTIEGVPDME